MLGHVVSKRLLTHCLHCILGLVLFKRAESLARSECVNSVCCPCDASEAEKSERDACLITGSGVRAKLQQKKKGLSSCATDYLCDLGQTASVYWACCTFS